MRHRFASAIFVSLSVCSLWFFVWLGVLGRTWFCMSYSLFCTVILLFQITVEAAAFHGGIAQDTADTVIITALRGFVKQQKTGSVSF